MKKFYIQIAVNKSDYDLLTKYGFLFEKNINIYLKDIADQIRQAEQEQEQAETIETINKA